MQKKFNKFQQLFSPRRFGWLCKQCQPADCSTCVCTLYSDPFLWILHSAELLLVCNCRVTDAWNFPLLQPPLVNAGLLPVSVPLIPWLQLLKTSPRQGPLMLSLTSMHFYHQWVQSICQGPRQDVTVEAHLHRSLNAPKHL